MTTDHDDQDDWPQKTTDHDDQEERWLTTKKMTDHDDWPRRSRRLTTKNDWSRRRLTTTPKKNNWPRKKRLTTTTEHDMTLHHFDLRRRVHVQLLTYVDISGWKVSIVLLSANALWDMFAVKKDVSVRIFWHTSPWLCAVSNIIFHWFTQCDVSLQNCINCETWRRASFH